MGVRVGIPVAQASEMAVAHQQNTNPQKANRQNANRQNTAASHNAHSVHFAPPWVCEHEPDLDRQALERIADLVQKNISPLVAIEPLGDRPWAGQTLHQPDSLLCDITGVAHLFGGESQLLQAADAQFARLGLSVRMAIANGVTAAWGLAHYADDRQTILPMTGRSHTDHAYTNPADTDPADTDPADTGDLDLELAAQSSGESEAGSGVPIEAALLQLPVQSLRIAPETVTTLARLGVHHVDQLLRLPRSGLATR
ncbi:MAG: hypothetical protein HKN47_18265, partial [Pirellulaceae bacterium]|nr:hypothetical protein [Pirellulaceae bacterium]